VVFVGAAASGLPEGKEGLMHLPGVIEVASAGNQPALVSVLYAPGREILTLLPGGHYDFASGDSIATAEVSGVVALLLAKNAKLSATDTYRLLHDSSTKSDAAGGATLVDACAAVVSLVHQGACNPVREVERSVATGR
jgi:subtilisin family serine protease